MARDRDVEREGPRRDGDAPQRRTNAGPAIGTPAVVDTLGNWGVRVDSPVNPVPSRASVQSSAGGALTNLVVSVK